MSGITRRRVMARTSSTATKFSGSAIARCTSVRLAFTGTTICFFATFLGRIWAISDGMDREFRSTYSTPTWFISVSMSCRSVMKPWAWSTVPSRSPLPA